METTSRVVAFHPYSHQTSPASKRKTPNRNFVFSPNKRDPVVLRITYLIRNSFPHCTKNWPYRQNDLPPIGKGTYGEVVRITTRNGRQVLAKKSRINIPEDSSSEQETHEGNMRYAKDVIREGGILRFLEVSYFIESIASHHISFFPCKPPSFPHQGIIILERVGNANLYQMIHSEKGRKFTTTTLFCYWMISIADSLEQCHSKKIVHCDVKPQNIVVKEERATLVDYGMARSLYRELNRKLGIENVRVITTPYYRAPECWFSGLYSTDKETSCATSFGPWIDIWSLGVIFCEYALRNPPLNPAISPIPINDIENREFVFFYMLKNQNFSIPDDIETVFRSYSHLYNKSAEELLEKNYIDKEGYRLIKESEQFKTETIQSRVEEALMLKAEDAIYQTIIGLLPNSQESNSSKFKQLKQHHKLACQQAKDIALLTSRMLCIDPLSRPSAREVSEELKRIFSVPG